MNSAKGFLNKIALAGTGMGGSNGGGGTGAGMTENKKNRFGVGIGNTAGGIAPISTSSNATAGYLGRWGEDRITNVAIGVRMAQTIFLLYVGVAGNCILIVDIVLASFQNQWIGAISGLTGLLIIITVLTFLFSAFLLATSFLPGSWQTSTDRIIMTMEQPRLGLVMNSTGLGIWLILSITQIASALSSAACKDPSSDPHAKTSKGNHDDFVKALPTFCSTKKAGAAFCWLIWLTCLATMLLFLRFWKLSRKNGPRIPPFVHPADEGDFQPIADDVDDDYGGGHNGGQYNEGIPTSNRYGEGGDGRYGSGGEGGYGYNQSTEGRYDTGVAGGQHASNYTRTDPFADSTYMPRQSYDYGAYGGGNTPQDPYAAIQHQLRSDRPPQLPPLYRG